MDLLYLWKKISTWLYHITIQQGHGLQLLLESSNFNHKTRLTFWGQSQRLPCCTCGSSHQTIWWQCSLTSWQSWRCRLCKASPLGSGFLLAGNPASGPRPIPAGHTLSCCPPASADRLPYLGAGKRQRKRCYSAISAAICALFFFFTYGCLLLISYCGFWWLKVNSLCHLFFALFNQWDFLVFSTLLINQLAGEGVTLCGRAEDEIDGIRFEALISGIRLNPSQSGRLLNLDI